MTNAIRQVQGLGQSIWLDFIRRGMLASGEFERYIDMGITGVTSNPSIFEKAIVGNDDYDDALGPLVGSGKETPEIYESLAIEDIRTAADMLAPIYEQAGGADGFVSLEVSPLLAFDARATVEEARRLFATVDRANLMIKVPGTPEGMPAVRRLIGEGINVNVTLLFSLDMYAAAREAYISGLETLGQNGGDVTGVASVASFFVSRLDTLADKLIEEKMDQGQSELKDLLGKVAVANARLAYQAFRETFEGERFAALNAGGAKVQRPLWASTSTKNPAYSDVLYVEPLIGPNTVNTLPPDTITAFLDHGRAEVSVGRGLDEARQTFDRLEAAGINLKAITDKLLSDGVKAFADSFEKLLAGIEKKKEQMSAA